MSLDFLVSISLYAWACPVYVKPIQTNCWEKVEAFESLFSVLKFFYITYKLHVWF
jgi:hypothetical protein